MYEQEIRQILLKAAELVANEREARVTIGRLVQVAVGDVVAKLDKLSYEMWTRAAIVKATGLDHEGLATPVPIPQASAIIARSLYGASRAGEAARVRRR